MEHEPPRPSQETIDSLGVPVGTFTTEGSRHLGFSWSTRSAQGIEHVRFIDSRYQARGGIVIARTLGADTRSNFDERADVEHLFERIQEDSSLDEIEENIESARRAATGVQEGLPISAGGWTVMSMVPGGRHSMAWQTGMLDEVAARAGFDSD